MESLPASEHRLKEIEQKLKQDLVCVKLAQYCIQGRPDKSCLSGQIKLYHPLASEISIVNRLLMRKSRIIIPTSLQKQVLDQIHTGHQGLNKCRERARQSVWWPGLSKQLQELIANCHTCCKASKQRTEPMISSPFPDLPWQKLGMDLFEFNKITYLLIVDYYSRYIEVAKLNHSTAEEVILHCKSIFARHGIPEEVITDNGPQFIAELFSEFTRNYQFSHITGSPYHPMSNGEAKRVVGTVKSLLRKKGDPYLALLAYRVTPLQNGYSPCQLRMGRTLHYTLSTTRKAGIPFTPDNKALVAREKQLREKRKDNFDHRHRVQELPVLTPGDMVWVPDRQEGGTIEDQVGPRSYQVETP